MKVLHLISSGGMYGAEAVILQLCAEMEGNHWGRAALAVFAPYGAEPELSTVAREAGVDVLSIPCQGQVDRAALHRLRALVQSTGSDVVHAHGYKADLYALTALRSHRKAALVSTCHTWYDNDLAVRLYGLADRWALQHFEEVVAVSGVVEGQLHQAGVAPGRVTVIRNGISVDHFAHVAASRRDKRVKALVVGLVGRLAPEKGVDLFLETIARLKQESPDARFVVAGEGPERVALESLRTRLGLQDTLEFLGAVRDMDALYASLDVLVSASRQEGLPMVLLEGMASGLPVVATAVGEVPRVVVNEETGYVVAPNEPQVLASALRSLLLSEQLRVRLGENGRQRIAEEFSARRMTAEYMTVYKRALRRRGISIASAPIVGASL